MANKQHLDVLRQGVEIWNSWRQDNNTALPNLSRVQLQRVSLRSINFSKTNLTRADLRLSDLTFAQLTNAQLNGAFLHGTTFFAAKFRKASLREAQLRSAELGSADFCDANLTNASLREAKIARAQFVKANLSDADLSGANLSEANLSEANLREADLSGANLRAANLSGADLRGTHLKGADLSWANLTHTQLNEADLSGAQLSRANFSGADLSGASLIRAILVRTDLSQTNLTGCYVYGISAWNTILLGANQASLIITPIDEPVITVDNLQVAQFIYLLLNNTEIRQVIDVISKKVVLILGRFTDERKTILDAIRDQLRARNYLPILFDFQQPSSRDLTETISTLAHLARFIIADITDAKSIPQELQAIIPNLPSVPVQPLITITNLEYSMFEHFRRYPWVLPIYRYVDTQQLLTCLVDEIITPAEAKAYELQAGKE